ncbi:response regulator [Sulfurospirillum diekertiae]|jgi:YesN/AraC family two-component response regulator|uniref:Response regulator n=1 Tax=Sulfurospirillum diekertiae TaxID=1854492 RepID=A0A290HCR1_9BACT|nr:response regulator [Sulfurospirillum diekertiae]ATB69342.1 response regulator receiver [Sulfurospirillum diekertiae]QIR76988.1 response regulator [Sulfurospirillum diekertiae]QIR79603.1 response regulator [Sulfurospirillum diekertiae]
MKLNDLKEVRPLIVEDEHNVLDSLFSVFNTVFDEFYTARNGEEGLYRFYKDAPDIIITDLQMPFMSGFRMLNRIRIENPTIPIIITSAYSSQDQREQAEKLGVNGYLVKPYDMDMLFAKIDECCCNSTLGKIDLDQFSV